MPFLSLARQLTGDPNLAFTTQAVLLPPEVDLDPALQQEYELELQQAGNVPLPEDDNDFLA
jgi:GTP-binding nuclear protein Ran